MFATGSFVSVNGWLKPQDDVKHLFSQLLQACNQLLHAKKEDGLRVEYDNQ